MIRSSQRAKSDNKLNNDMDSKVIFRGPIRVSERNAKSVKVGWQTIASTEYRVLTSGLILRGFMSDDLFIAPFEMRPCLREMPVTAADSYNIVYSLAAKVGRREIESRFRQRRNGRTVEEIEAVSAFAGHGNILNPP